ncbi:MAG: DNA repair protein RadC [Rhodanobacteraceae bacterium]|nr:MAG: DNA repair protein RadC [Rhodanobacteraceae bacterium]
MNTNVITSQARAAKAAEAKAGLTNGQVREAIHSEDAPPAYEAAGGDSEHDNEIIAEALAILDRRMFKAGEALMTPRDTAAFLKLKLGCYQWEVFGVLFLDNRHRVIAFEEMFRGTLDGASVHPREVVRAALNHNAAAVIFSHNHPSGVSEPSAADRNITRQLRDALQLIGVRVLDHVVIGAGEPTSMAGRGLI